ncbi:MAG: hypothetical protein C4527_16735 [Candidatus Omnitrophota bacterium]|jgi:hypothetical protein|nr:MAG: hypothetical protein C4527_16735 [Candidatus Omnitrophota bacterium]
MITKDEIPDEMDLGLHYEGYLVIHPTGESWQGMPFLRAKMPSRQNHVRCLRPAYEFVGAGDLP